MDRFWAAPPVSRTIVAAMAIESLLVYGGLLSGDWIWFDPRRIFFKLPPQVWRVATSFLLTGPRLDFVFDLYFTWIYGTGLELNSPRFSQPGSFFVYVVFVATIIAALASTFVGAGFFTAGLMMAFIYTYAQDNRGKKAHIIIIQIPVEYLPVATLAITMVVDGPYRMMIQLTGLLAAHLYDFLTRLYPTFQGGRNYIQTPLFVKRWFGADQSAFSHKKYGTSFRPGQNLQQPAAASRGWTSGFSGSSWTGRGQGRRLGSD